jgi:hypothetical protein
MSKYNPNQVSKPYVALMEYKDGGESVQEYFHTADEAFQWIQKQRQPRNDTWKWQVKKLG